MEHRAKVTTNLTRGIVAVVGILLLACTSACGNRAGDGAVAEAADAAYAADAAGRGTGLDSSGPMSDAGEPAQDGASGEGAPWPRDDGGPNAPFPEGWTNLATLTGRQIQLLQTPSICPTDPTLAGACGAVVDAWSGAIVRGATDELVLFGGGTPTTRATRCIRSRWTARSGSLVPPSRHCRTWLVAPTTAWAAKPRPSCGHGRLGQLQRLRGQLMCTQRAPYVRRALVDSARGNELWQGDLFVAWSGIPAWGVPYRTGDLWTYDFGVGAWTCWDTSATVTRGDLRQRYSADGLGSRQQAHLRQR
jgi:hypothetical protein